MSNKKSSTSSVSGGASKVKSSTSSVTSEGAVERHRINMRMTQNVRLIWLDSKIDKNNADYCDTMAQLRRAVNTIDTYTDGEQCLQYLKTMETDKVCMVISGSLGQQVVPRLHDISQVDSIFIFCGNKKHHEQWTKNWSKIKGLFTEISPICEALKQAAQRCEQNAISMSFVATSGDLSKKKLDQLDPSFMYTQILKEILLTIEFEPKHFKEFIEYCHEVFDKNPDELKNVEKLEKSYHDETPVWWYTFDCFLYPLLNRSLRLMNVDIMIKMGFFISDLHRHIDRLHQEQYGSQKSDENFIVYRGQGMSKTEFNQMSQTRGGLVSFNNFLSTSKDKTVSLNFANAAVTNPDLVSVLFAMTINPSQSTTPFASIVDISYYKNEEDEVLFGMHTIFRIDSIQTMSGNHGLYQVNLTLTNDNDKDLRQLTDRIREETEGSTGWDQLSGFLLKIGQPEKAEQVYNMLLDQTTEEIEIARTYHQIGCAKYAHGDFKEALTFYNKSLAIQQKSLPSNHPDLAMSYNNIGNVYSNMGEYSKALSYYEKTLDIDKKTLPPNHPDLAKSYNNIGGVYSGMGEYSKVLLYYEKALVIRQKSLPPNHPDLASSYNNIGAVYSDMGEYSKALSAHEKALTIRQQSLPPNHPNLASSYSNIGNVYSTMGEYSEALSSHEKAFSIWQQSLPPNHPDLASSYNNIGNVYSNMGEYSKALSSHKKALDIREQSLPPNHPDLTSSYNNIGLVYSAMDDYSKARKFFERAVKIGEQSLSSDHPHLQMYRSNLDRIKNKL